VTAERSPPDSRITGADSPVMADSSTDAMPSTTSPSPGMIMPGTTSTRSPMLSSVDGLSTVVPSRSRTRAIVSDRVLRKVSACALPRPSATASAKLAKRTVNHNQMATRPVNTLLRVLPDRFWKNRMLVQTLPTSTMNMTGLRSWTRGSSFLKLSPTAGLTISGANRACALRPSFPGASPGASTGGRVSVFIPLLRSGR
jgi:hypothetical protein